VARIKRIIDEDVLNAIVEQPAMAIASRLSSCLHCRGPLTPAAATPFIARSAAAS
jgi:hypothetical protein